MTDLNIETDLLFEALADTRRRFVLTTLPEAQRPIPLQDITNELAAWEHGTEITEISDEDVRSIYLSLYHNHIPKLADVGLVHYNEQRDKVALTEHAEELPNRDQLITDS